MGSCRPRVEITCFYMGSVRPRPDTMRVSRVPLARGLKPSVFSWVLFARGLNHTFARVPFARELKTPGVAPIEARRRAILDAAGSYDTETKRQKDGGEGEG